MKNPAIIILLILLLCLYNSSFAQYYRIENSKWRMCAYVGVDFTGNGPVATTSEMVYIDNNQASSASVTDESGNLLFYTNGFKVWDAGGSVMPHADTLNGVLSGSSASIGQGALIVPTHHKGIYYLFTLVRIPSSTSMGYQNRLFCYKLDMSLNGGMGDIDTSASLYHMPVCDSLTEKMIAVPGCNGNIWVLVHSDNVKAFYAFEVDAADSVHTTPVISNYSGGILPFPGYLMQGDIKVSPMWDKVAIGVPCLATLHFDRATGQLSDYQKIDSVSNYFSPEFSPDGKMLYGLNSSNLYQYDLSASAVNYNKTLITAGNGKNKISLKLAPDSSIYFHSLHLPDSNLYFSRIKYPDSAGVACGYEEIVNNLVLQNPDHPDSAELNFGLPNLVVFPVSEQDTFNLYLDTLLCTMPDTPVILTASPYYAQKVWSTGAVTDTIMVSETGTYWVTYTNGCAQRVDTYKISTLLPPVSISYANGLLATTNVFATYQWYKDGNMITGATAQSVNATGDGVYKVVVSNGSGCTDSAEYVLEGSGVGSINAAKDIAIYPNPARDQVWIKCPVYCTLAITGVDGKVYYEGQGSSAPIDISKYGNGMYYVVLKGADKELLGIRKLVVMK